MEVHRCVRMCTVHDKSCGPIIFQFSCSRKAMDLHLENLIWWGSFRHLLDDCAVHTASQPGDALQECMDGQLNC